jgi:hypothetical protein
MMTESKAKPKAKGTTRASKPSKSKSPPKAAARATPRGRQAKSIEVREGDKVVLLSGPEALLSVITASVEHNSLMLKTHRASRTIRRGGAASDPPAAETSPGVDTGALRNKDEGNAMADARQASGPYGTWSDR